jgi:pyridoxamine 5'-phosphate oxidase
LGRDALALKVRFDTSVTEKFQGMDRAAINAMRRSYGEQGLSESNISSDPISQFQIWLKEAAENSVIVEANAMVLSTVNGDSPTSRTVLLKDVTKSGFTFFTNYDSRKASEISGNKNVSLLFPWYAMERQVIVLGQAEKISEADSEKYFATRPWSSQIGAWASSQSEPLESREALEKRWQEFSLKYPEGTTVPKPAFWGGFLVTPSSIEFWQGRYSRLHDRLRFTRKFKAESGDWEMQRIFP